jgi:hypothetical protein
LIATLATSRKKNLKEEKKEKRVFRQATSSGSLKNFKEPARSPQKEPAKKRAVQGKVICPFLLMLKNCA